MNKKIKIVLFSALAVAVVAGASLLYRTLSNRYNPDQTINAGGTVQAGKSTDAGTAESSGTANAGNTDMARSDTGMASGDTGMASAQENTAQTGDMAAASGADTASGAENGDSSSAGSADGAAETPPAEPQKSVFSAPDFTVYDANGQAVALSSFNGRPIVINFWASWCGYCVKEMPEFQAAYEKYGSSVVFLMVNLITSDSRQQAQSLIAGKGFTFPVYYDTDGRASAAYPSSGIPYSVFIGTDGQVAAKAVGAMTGSRLQQYITQIYPAAG